MWRYILAALVLALSQPAFADAFADYRAVQIALASANVTDDTVAKARKLFPDQVKLIEKIEAAARADRKYIIGNRQIAQSAYRDFIFAPANADVLHAFISNQLTLLDTIPMGTRPGMLLAWSWAPLNMGAVIGYEATGEKRFIDQALRISRVAFENIDDALGIKEDFNREDVRGWSFDHYKRTGREHTLPALIVSPMLRLALAVKGSDIDEEIQSEITKNADAGIKIIKSYLKFQIRDGDVRYFNYVFTGDEDAFNHIAAYALAASYAYKLTGNTEFRDFCDGFLKYFRRHVPVSPDGAYSWDYQNVDKKRHRSELWKEAVTVPSIVYMAEQGINVSTPDKIGLLRGFTGYIARTNRSVYARMGEDDFPLTGYNLMLSEYTSVQLFANYVALDQWDPDIRTIVLETIVSRSDLFPEGLLVGFYSAPAYAHLLRYKAMPAGTMTKVMRRVIEASSNVWASVKSLGK